MRRALVGVLGHVDHGKTALVRALTGTDTDRLPEEKRRGISILPGYARLEGEGGELDLVDVPGHERFVRAMAAGASAMRAALLVVDAREGPRAQTREHAGIAALFGVRRGLVAITRTDLAGTHDVASAVETTRDMLARFGLGPWPCLPCSALSGGGLAALRAALLDLAEPAAMGEAGQAWMPLDRAFHRPGTGLVVTGALRSGRLVPGEVVEIWPGPRQATIRALQSHGRALDEAGPGRRLAVALKGDAAGPGDALASPGLLAASPLLDAWVTVLPDAPRALRREAFRLLCGTSECDVRLRLLDRAELAPGESGAAQLQPDGPLALPVRARFLLRLPLPLGTLAGGVVLDAEAPRRRGRDAALLHSLAALPTQQAAQKVLEAVGARGVPTERLRRLAGGRLPEGAVALTGGTSMAEPALAELEAALRGAVQAAVSRDALGPGPEARALLRSALPAGAPGEAVAARLVARGVLRLAAGRFTLPTGPALGGAEQRLLREVEAAFREAALSPPEPASVAAGDRMRMAAMRHLLAKSILLRAPDAVQKREWIFHRDALAEARSRLAPALAASAEGLTVSECDKLLGLTRRHGVPLLERLDAEGFTRRDGDRRRLSSAAGGEAGPQPRLASAEG
ncbi:selenocysteine-specific translation elongation factor [Sabulicella glaciei]|uniref:SelB C-terminal domain-containing protein n=1 Tax=Sabulicella glaciei TaxID=2984948 RepID=A0ABT3NRI1_9PROT|nr:selenocysteine-specific translation elongation factor [Roseococcus sp. MDT2-1-1]MCW8084775.1 SelB C-terminal domain-containing protein [Roseococcus sp. MDT2-1-1]